MFDVLVVGGGAAGFFAALAAAKANAGLQIGLIEKSSKFLSKVAISGGGRCNVTHNAATIDALLAGYPRGARELKGAFLTFSHFHTQQWFEERGVELVAEKDGRIFPVSNSSQSIINCLLNEAEHLGVELYTNCAFNSMKQIGDGWEVETGIGVAKTKKLILAPGGAVKEEHLLWAKALGISIRLPVPSLFTFDIRDKNLNALSGLSVPTGIITIAKEKPIEGPVLITHWGVSGPAVLKASAWYARKLHEWNYNFQLRINWCGLSVSELNTLLDAKRKTNGGQTLVNKLVLSLPNRLWQHLVEKAGIATGTRYGDLLKSQMDALRQLVLEDTYLVESKSVNKDEFVTSGGIDLREVQFKTMAFRRFPNLYVAGEVLDIDGITGGFNFQSAWTTGYIAGKSAAEACYAETEEKKSKAL